MAKTYEDQADKRIYETFRDQHGRFWGANIEIKTGDPCEVLKPQFTSPIEPAWAKGIFIPPEDVVEMVPRNERAKRGYSVSINYRKWLEKWDLRQIDYEKKLFDFARGMNKNASPDVIAQIVANPTQDLARHVGRPPFPPREFIVAMAANNKWALGQFNGIPAKALPILNAIQPILAAAKDRIGKLGEDPFADDEDELDLTGESENGAPAVVDPLGDFNEVVAGVAEEQLERQFDPSASGNQQGRPVPVGVGAGKAKPSTKKPKREE